MPAAAFGRVLPLAVIARPVERDPEKPGLKLAVSLERMEAFDDRQKHFLADLLHIFAGEVEAQLKDKAPGGGVMPVEEFIPRLRLTPAAGIVKTVGDCSFSGGET